MSTSSIKSMNVRPLEAAVKLYDHFEAREQVKHYYGLLAIYGLVQAAELEAERGDTGLLERCRAILGKFPDEIEHPRYNFPSYTIGGIPKAYAFYKRLMPESGGQVTEYAEEMMTAPRDPEGIMKHRYEPDRNLIWIDVAMAVTPYLLFAGLALGEERYIDEAARQTFLMVERFMDPDNGLLHQCLNFVAPGVFSEDHWSRGNGWGYIGLTELVRHLPANSPHRPQAERLFREMSAALLPHQSERGLWRQEIPFEYSYEESSGTALFLYGYGTGIRLGLLERSVYEPAFRRGIEGLWRHCINEDFSTERSCPGCLCPGEGKEKGTVKAYVTLKLPHRDEPHSFGPFILALTEAHLNGISELKR
ncbi:unsaturated rhamnogalacturonyl hydrolase [Paenibacillus sp. UNCCL117]|uniref:glycoside hydrolase family 88 protein n=1 Tax=unclassified Paenibacillus TaxID=185978 RepID=UPI00088885C3|nr:MULTISPECIES: glycoside hydrolase family 88 protein [unclassified Paenibacillus]SDD75346.1 unsaturated rhamnogalacturonyl hydrolase [Paenibacillus sp. cl123]SFW52137.1 unsaturated rhamnogalacturonyl hydrolase [Paenibacillus sp. UNCCL117]